MGEPVTTLLGFFLSAATAFSKLMGWLGNENRNSRERVATYFDQIAACMREVAERIEAGDPPQDTCRRLAVYADELQRILDRHEYIISAGDVSFEATRSRLVREIKQTQQTWLETDEQRRAASAAKGVVDRANVGYYIYASPTPAAIAKMERLTDRLEDEFVGHVDVRGSVQQIWDAAGEFAALADALRAR
jgi:hypothetical protein